MVNRTLNQSDQDIIAGFMAGREAEIDFVTGWIKEVVYARVWEQEISREDLIADTMYKLLVNFRENTFNFESSLKTYVQRVTMFTVVDAVRMQRRLRRQRVELDSQMGLGEDPSQSLNEKEDLILFHRIFLRLDRKCRELWIMILHDALTYKAIAEKLDVAEGTVKTRVFRCKEKALEIRKSLE